MVYGASVVVSNMPTLVLWVVNFPEPGLLLVQHFPEPGLLLVQPSLGPVGPVKPLTDVHSSLLLTIYEQSRDL